MASTVNVLHVQFSYCFVVVVVVVVVVFGVFLLLLFFYFLFVCFFLFSLIQRSVSVLFMIISYLFNFTGFCSYSEALLWFCCQSKFVKRVSLPLCG